VVFGSVGCHSNIGQRATSSSKRSPMFDGDDSRSILPLREIRRRTEHPADSYVKNCRHIPFGALSRRLQKRLDSPLKVVSQYGTDAS
jgi:hypothetical protein